MKADRASSRRRSDPARCTPDCSFPSWRRQAASGYLSGGKHTQNKRLMMAVIEIKEQQIKTCFVTLERSSTKTVRETLQFIQHQTQATNRECTKSCQWLLCTVVWLLRERQLLLRTAQLLCGAYWDFFAGHRRSESSGLIHQAM